MAMFKQVPKAKAFNGNVNSFADINSYLSNFDKDGSSATDSKSLDVEEWIHTGSYKLNALISGSVHKGAPSNRIITVSGEPKSGKSYLIKNLIRGYQKAGYFPLIIESETAYTKEQLVAQGINPDGCRILGREIETPNDVTVFMAKLTKGLAATKAAGGTVPKLLLVIDSLNGLLPGKTISDAESGDIKVDMGNQAKELKLMMNFASTRLAQHGIAMICTAHLYKATNAANMVENIISGGMGSVYFSSIILGLRKYNDRDADTKETVGIRIVADVIESRFARKRKADLFLKYATGMNEFYGLIEFCSLPTCGIGRGKFVDYFDIANILLKKKVITKDTVADYFCSIKEIEQHLSKANTEFLTQNIKKAVEMGYIYIVGGGSDVMKNSIIGFTSKTLQNFKGDTYEPVLFQYGIANDSSPNWVVEHLGKTMPYEKLFTKEVFTKEVLDKIDVQAQKYHSIIGGSIETSFEEMSEDEIVDNVEKLMEMADSAKKDFGGTSAAVNEFLNGGE